MRAFITWTRAGCVALLGYYGEQLDSWVCGAPQTGLLPAVTYWLSAGKPFGFYRVAIRNNNRTYAAMFNSTYFCCR